MQPSGTTRLTCLLGSPVSHSISPAMHNTAFEALGLDYSYMAFDISESQIKNAIDALKLLNCRGFNLTMPLKTAIIPYLDELSEAARLSHSVNTCVFEDGKLIGHTTDGIGFMEAMTDSGISYKNKVITILGAGGAATSIIVQAALDGVSKINIFKRKNATFDKIVDFADKITRSTDCDVFVFDMADATTLEFCLQESDILINGTNVGMGDDDSSLVPVEFLRKELIVTDVIYHPAYTRLLKDAKSLGCKVMNGKYMLLYQGAAAFKLWTGQDMPIDLIKEKCFTED
ncbi:shikimate dehydrogenase [Pseudobutyrivibrio sp.]|uniref:shikimate dehydrogenase n=1 Tax=Pseudobutyrivibrio sp. TaxID=2014367 RepID=UPI001D667415|nr:shikimate dehydrogenase [Pseudobutyrivibrio sp.]MBE5910181.1 shikimate dehydrogenase [Pseudobutyrivibrio sp.]